MTLQVPADIDPQHLAELNHAEHAYAQKLQQCGMWRHLWRVVGKTQNISIFEVTDPDELHEILTALPLFPYMQIDVAALARHPGAIDTADQGTSE